jgi:geranylgeranyl pyrophosphate synthase
VTIKGLAKLLDIPELPNYLEQVDQALEEILVTSNSSLSEPSLRLIKSGGKRMRPTLVIASALSQEKRFDSGIILACAAIELVHLGSIVHDDILDNADLRWGKPAINKQLGLKQAILVGDYLLALAAVQANSVSKEAGYMIANTIAIMCEGQSQETADEFNTKRSIESYYDVTRKKTAALISSACRIGALCAGVGNEQVEALANYGESFGMAFQLLDDVSDFLSTSAAMGKPVGNDVKEGVYTLPLLIALRGSHRKQLIYYLDDIGNKSANERIVGILLATEAFTDTIREINSYNTAAKDALKGLDDNKVISGLSELPDMYMKWILQKQTKLSLNLD